MSSKIVKSNQARSIARNMAFKAFEHLFNPLEEKLQVFLKREYDRTLLSIGFTPELIAVSVNALVLELRSQCIIHICELDDDDADDADNAANGTHLLGGLNEWCYDTHTQLTTYPVIYLANLKVVLPAAAVCELVELTTKIEEIKTRREALCSTLENELTGRKVSYIVKNWPEAMGFVYDVMNITSGTEAMIVPLEDLIKKHLLLIESPKEAPNA